MVLPQGILINRRGVLHLLLTGINDGRTVQKAGGGAGGGSYKKPLQISTVASATNSQLAVIMH